MLICSGTCTLNTEGSRVFRTKAVAAINKTRALIEAVMDSNVMPIGDNPKNKPTSPAKPKLKATDNTSSSMTSTLFLPKNKTFTKQYPGKKETKTKLRI